MKTEMYEHIYQVEQNHWWYVARRKIIFDWLLRVLEGYVAPRVLDVGCGTGFNLELLRNNGYGHAIGLDMSPEALRFCQSRQLTLLACGDGTHPPFPDSSFDVITALDMIEHLKDDAQALHALARLLKPDGTLIVFTPAFMFLWGLQDEVSHHQRRYTARELRHKLEAAGLTIYKLTYANTLLFPLVWAGRTFIRLTGTEIDGTSENDLHPGWTNGLLQSVFAAERPLLRHADLPFGVSLLAVVGKPKRA